MASRSATPSVDATPSCRPASAEPRPKGGFGDEVATGQDTLEGLDWEAVWRLGTNHDALPVARLVDCPCEAPNVDGIAEKRVLVIAKAPCHTCAAFADKCDNDRDRLHAQAHVPQLLRPRTKLLIDQLQAMGTFPRKPPLGTGGGGNPVLAHGKPDVSRRRPVVPRLQQYPGRRSLCPP